MIEITSNANFCFKMSKGMVYFKRGAVYHLDDKEQEKIDKMTKMNLATISNKAFFPQRDEKQTPEPLNRKDEVLPEDKAEKKEPKKKAAKKSKK